MCFLWNSTLNTMFISTRSLQSNHCNLGIRNSLSVLNMLFSLSWGTCLRLNACTLFEWAGLCQPWTGKEGTAPCQMLIMGWSEALRQFIVVRTCKRSFLFSKHNSFKVCSSSQDNHEVILHHYKTIRGQSITAMVGIQVTKQCLLRTPTKSNTGCVAFRSC